MIARVVGLVAVFLVAAAPALGGDRELLSALDRGLPATISASQSAAGGNPVAVQSQYDQARSLQERVRAAGSFSPSCHALGGWAARYAAAEVAAAEGFDRLEPARARRWRTAASEARSRIVAARRSCRPSVARRAEVTPTLEEPRPYAASFGEIVARAPAGADVATLFANGGAAGPLALAGGVARGRLTGTAGRYDLEVRFTRQGSQIGVARSGQVWLLPQAAGGVPRAAVIDGALQSQLRAAANRFGAPSGIWVHDLATGRAASWNAGAVFPAASTVKLAVMVEALRRMGPAPDQSASFHDVQGIGAWSSNLAANRLLGRIGGSAGAQAALRRMGATSSTYTGRYIPATERPPISVQDPPPRVSRRVTTAADLGALMLGIHEAAVGDRAALSRTGMTRRQARLALGLLLSSEQQGDNRGILRDALGPSVPAAQKQGWISSARHSAAIVYTERGPLIVVVLTYRPGLSRTAAADLGGEVVRLSAAATSSTRERARPR